VHTTSSYSGGTIQYDEIALIRVVPVNPSTQPLFCGWDGGNAATQGTDTLDGGTAASQDTVVIDGAVDC